MTIQEALLSGKKYFKRPEHRHWYEKGRKVFSWHPIVLAEALGRELAFTYEDLLATDWEATDTIDIEKQRESVYLEPEDFF